MSMGNLWDEVGFWSWRFHLGTQVEDFISYNTPIPCEHGGFEYKNEENARFCDFHVMVEPKNYWKPVKNFNLW
jgi:hypothetical protein